MPSAAASHLRSLQAGARVISLHRQLLAKTDAFGHTTERLMEAPEVLLAEKDVLQTQLDALMAAASLR